MEIEIVQLPEGTSTIYRLAWEPSHTRERAAWANADEATRDGAYAVALASAEVELGLVAVSRAETLTGSDYYLGVAAEGEPHDDLEKAYRLEVSGVDRGRRAILRRRLRQKVNQVRRGASLLPAFACVVGFQTGSVVVQKVEENHE
jgi:hypothetical protein